MRLKKRFKDIPILDAEAGCIKKGKTLLASTEESISGEKAGQTRLVHDRTWELRGCPRCNGDIFLDSEDGDLLEHCLQCGYVGLAVVARKASPYQS